jgi:hypothetical protein
MTRFRFDLTLPVLILLGASTVLAGDNPKVVKEVAIKSYWGGLGTPQKTELVILNEKGKYYLGHKSVDSNLVEALVSALNEPAIQEPNLANLGITPQWLKENAVSAALKNAASFSDAAQNQKELFIKSFSNSDVMNKIVPGMFRFVRTDDYPSAGVVVTFDDGSSLSADSRAWYEFMLPWKLSRNGETTYNGDISRALAALMPKKATNRERLAGQGFDAALAEMVMRYIEDDWKLLDTENKIGGVLTSIRTEFAVESAEINPYHHPEYGLKWSGKQPHETNLHAILHRADAPSNYVVGLVLQLTNNKVEGVEEFLRSSQRYESLPLSVPWLNDYIREHPRPIIRVSYVHNASFGDKAIQVFSADMHAIGKDSLVADAKAEQSQITLLIAGIQHAESYWLVFPDKHLILWRYGGPSGLLNWTRADFSANPCSEYQGVVGGCVGAVVSPDGMFSQ